MPSEGKNNIDISRFVAIGDSITAGYSDGALFYEGQLNSYANLMAMQFKPAGAGGENFKQPLMNKDSVGIGFFGNSRLVLKKSDGSSEKKHSALAYLSPTGDLSAFATNVFASLGPFNNMSVPGAKAISIVTKGYGNPMNGAGNFNPFFTRMSSDPSTSSILSDALISDPTFFSLFIGNNDVLAHALSGGTADNITAVSGENGFESTITKIINALSSNGAKGVVANIPDIISIPYFTTIHFDDLMLNAENVSRLNLKYSNSGIYFYVGKNPFLTEDPSEKTLGIRQMKKGEFILLDVMLDEKKNEFLNGDLPIPKKYILTCSEILKIQSAVTDYNTILKLTAQKNGLAFVDINFLIRSVRADRVYDKITHRLHYKRRGIFSLDGVHLNSLGQAFLADEFINSINFTYGSSIPNINYTKFRRVSAPD